MAYTFDKSRNEIVVSGFENGISPSPYLGIGNMRNVGTHWMPGVAYVNYRRQAATLGDSSSGLWFAGSHSTNVSNNEGWIFSGGTVTMGNPVQSCQSPAGLNYILDSNGMVWKQSAVNSSTFNVLGNERRQGMGNGGIAYWNNYIVVFGAGLIEFNGNGTGDAGITSSNWNLTNPLNAISETFTTNYAAQSHYLYPSNPVTVLPYFQVGTPVTFTTTGTLPAGLSTGTTYYIVDVDATNEIYEVSATLGGSPITLTSDGSGTQTMNTSIAVQLPIGNVTTISLSWGAGVTSATITSYTNPNGTSSPIGIWELPTGTYNIVDTNGNNLLAEFVNNTTTVNFLSPTVFAGTAASVNILNTNVSSRAYTSNVDGNVYFANGQSMGFLQIVNDNVLFNPALSAVYAVSYAVFTLATGANYNFDSIVDMVDLQSTMIVAGQSNVYTWDYVSSYTTAPVPVGEPIQRLKNLLNSIYITAGQKGNVYVSNGSYVQLMYKIPDYIAGVIDPVWTFGDLMRHRGKIYFQAMAQTTSGTNILAGIFSLIVSPAVTGEVASGLVMEAQNSYGLTPSSGALGVGILIDDVPSSSGQDSYYSVYSTGASSGAIDFNDTSVWQNFEPTIETDIIPIGTFLDKKTPGQIQFMLDRPMASGDEIQLSWRQSLSDSYTTPVVATTTTLANTFGSNLSQIQWIQFKVQFKGASSGTSFIPLREIRISIK